ncbi:MAG: uridine kinase [Candidatus Aegiribacteria sp.]|nr:uridine kinase [Candidatus Aegiribacteria sp.]
MASINLPHPTRVGIDGVDCSGKTTLADELAEQFRNRGSNVIRISADGFHNPEDIRYRQGRYSPGGFYEDTFDNAAIVNSVLKPLGPCGNLIYRTSSWDLRTDSAVERTFKKAEADDLLLFDGIFLHRPELSPYWDFSIFIRADFKETLRRACKRDAKIFGSQEEVKSIYRKRYIPGQIIYLNAINPAARADIVLDNNDIEHP